MRIEVRDLKRHFGKTKAVDGVSFGFSEGQIFGFVGPNGAGKTTTLRIMATLDEPTAGEVYLDGVAVTQEPEAARRLVGFVPDSLPEHKDITVHEYLDFFARAYGLRGKRRLEMVESLEEFTRLMGFRYKPLNALSKGMKQRVSLARSLVHDPSVLVMDEPAAGLDPRARIELRELLKALAGQGKAILISSHILTELSEIVDGAVIIESGKILRAGTMDEIVESDADRRVMLIRPREKPEALCRDLLLHPNVSACRLLGEEVEAEVEGTADDCCELLVTIIGNGYRILEFRQRRAHLEDVFMRVTKGEVS